MPTAKRSVTIARPIDDVFAFIADGEQCPKWRSGVLEPSGRIEFATTAGPVRPHGRHDFEVAALDRVKQVLEA